MSCLAYSFITVGVKIAWTVHASDRSRAGHCITAAYLPALSTPNSRFTSSRSMLMKRTVPIWLTMIQPPVLVSSFKALRSKPLRWTCRFGVSRRQK